MFTFDLINGPAGFDPLVIMILALGVDAYIGGVPFLFRLISHPVDLIRKLVRWFDKRLNKEQRGQKDRAIRGFFTVIIICLITVAIGCGVAWLSRNHPWGWIFEFFLISSVLNQRNLYKSIHAVGMALRDESLEDARRLLSPLTRRDPAHLDQYGIVRVSIETLFEKLNDHVVAPVFWFILFGLPGLIFYKTINVLDECIGHPDPKYRAFGFSAARLDDIVNLIPARLTGLLIIFAALFTPTAKPWLALKTMLRDAGKHRSFNSGWSIGAVAGALDIALAGPRHYSTTAVNDPWVGKGTAKVTHLDLRKALFLFSVTCLVNGGWLIAVAMIRFSVLP